MWRCSNCGTGIEDQYAHCWQCGTPNAVNRKSQPPASAVPAFASYEELAKVPSRPNWFLRRGPLQKGAIMLLTLIFFKIVTAPFLGTYGLYIAIGAAVITLIVILWRFFHRDPAEGVGIKLN